MYETPSSLLLFNIKNHNTKNKQNLIRKNLKSGKDQKFGCV